MAYSKKIPPIKIKLSIEEFNILVQVLTTQIENESEFISNKSSKIKDKLLRYSVPITDENEETTLDIRCYQNELLDIFYIFFDLIKKDEEANTNYFATLLQIRENIKKDRQTNNE